MKIIIIGDGKVGYSLAENLSKENNDVTIIDKDIEALRKANENLDVMCIRGNGVSTKVLLEAGVADVDVLIAATSSDEMNMVCCLTAKKLGAHYTVARIRDPEYANELSRLKQELGLDLVINPEQSAAYEIARLLRFPSAVYLESFVKGKVELVEINVAENSPIAGMKLRDIRKRTSELILVGAVMRDDNIVIPNGDFEIAKGDILYVIGKPSSVTNFCKWLGIYIQKIKNVMIVGGGRIAYYLTSLISDMGMKVKIIELDRERCVELTELLPDTLVINGDGSEEDLLKSENLSDMGAFVSLTGRDEENLMTALLAKQSGVPKVIAKITRMSYYGLVKNLGIDSIVSPKHIITDQIIKYVRGLKNAGGNAAESLYRIINGKAEIAVYLAGDSLKFLDIPIKDLNLSKGILLATIVRRNDIIIPHGNDVIKSGDRVIVISKGRNLNDFSDIIQ